MNKNGIPIALYVWSTAVLVSRFSMITIIFRITSWAAIITHTISESKTPRRNDDKLTRKVLHAVYPRIGSRNVHHYNTMYISTWAASVGYSRRKASRRNLKIKLIVFVSLCSPVPSAILFIIIIIIICTMPNGFFFLQSYCSNIMYDLVLEANTRVELVLLKGRVQPSLVRKWRL